MTTTRPGRHPSPATMSDDPRYVAHAHRADGLRRVLPDPLASYWHGYRLGMVRGDRPPASSEERARDSLLAAALRGDEVPTQRLALGCGDHDGRRWADVTAHRGILRLAMALHGGSVRGLARYGWQEEDESVRQMLAGTRPLPADRVPSLHELALAAMDDAKAASPTP